MTYDKLEFEEFEVRYKDKIESAGLVVVRVYEYYYNNVYPFLELVAQFRGRENPVSEEIIQNVLKVSPRYFRMMKDIFGELKLALECKQGYMDLVAQVKLLHANNLKPDNAKTVEMLLQRYDKDYKNNETVDVNIPTTMKIEVVDVSVDEETLDD